MRGILVAEVQSKKPDAEWQLLQAFVGYLERHLRPYIDSITVTYRCGRRASNLSKGTEPHMSVETT